MKHNRGLLDLDFGKFRSELLIVHLCKVEFRVLYLVAQRFRYLLDEEALSAAWRCPDQIVVSTARLRSQTGYYPLFRILENISCRFIVPYDSSYNSKIRELNPAEFSH